MAKGLTLDIGANTREAANGARNVADAMEEISDALDPLVKNGDKAGKEIEDGLQRVPKEAEKAERSFKELARAAQRESRNAGDDIGRNIKRGTDEAGSGVNDFKGEAKQNAEEVAASFDGSADSIADGFQGLAASAFSGFGPAGVLAGVAAAAGIGLVTAEMTKQKDQTDELKERLAGLYTEAIDSGSRYISEAQILKGVQDLMFDAERVDEYNQAQEDAKTLGLDQSVLLRARAGDESAVNEVLDRRNAVADDLASKTATNDEALNTQYQRQNDALNRIGSSYGDIGTELDTNRAKAQLFADVEASGIERNASSRKRADDASTSRLDGMAAQILGLPDKVVRVTIDSSQAERQLEKLTGQARIIRLKTQISDPRTGQVNYEG